MPRADSQVTLTRREICGEILQQARPPFADLPARSLSRRRWDLGSGRAAVPASAEQAPLSVRGKNFNYPERAVVLRPRLPPAAAASDARLAIAYWRSTSGRLPR